MKNTSTWTVTVLEEGEDVILPFPDELLATTGWQEGDTLLWIDNEDGSWTLRKTNDSESEA
jgi:bifunctional DNA-binding transcriptional regulator/antitoxin component of YhaV-PrlF toxin-antitoxin module